MKNIVSFFFAISGGLLLGCQQDEVYKELPKAVYIASKVADGTTTMTNAVSVKKNVANGVAKIYVNQPYTKDVVVSYKLEGTAVKGLDYTQPTSLSVTVPAGKYYGEVNFGVLNNPGQTTNRTVIITLSEATEGFDLGIGEGRNYKVFTYTITP